MAVAGEAMRGIGRTETLFARSRSLQAACGIVSNAGHPHGYASRIDAEERSDGSTGATHAQQPRRKGDATCLIQADKDAG